MASNMQFEVIYQGSNGVVAIFPTHRRALNYCHRMAGLPLSIRRMVPMHPAEIIAPTDHPVLWRYRCEALQANGFWQPAGKPNHYTGQPQYWY